MAYRCPRCTAPVKRGFSAAAGAFGGALGALMQAASGPFQCESCGPIAKQEFSSADRHRMALGSMGLAAIAIVVLVAALFLLSL